MFTSIDLTVTLQWLCTRRDLINPLQCFVQVAYNDVQCFIPKPAYLAPERGPEYCDQSVCVSVIICVSVTFCCARAYLWNPCSELQQIFLSRYCGSVVLWRRGDMPCTCTDSSFVDDIIFSKVFITDRINAAGNAIASVCLSVRPSVSTLSSETTDRWP